MVAPMPKTEQKVVETKDVRVGDTWIYGMTPLTVSSIISKNGRIKIQSSNPNVTYETHEKELIRIIR